MRFRARHAGTELIDDEQRLLLNGHRLESADYSGRKLVQLSVAGSRLEGCNFEGSTIDSASMGAGSDQSEWIECSFDGSQVRFGPGGHARFVRCSFREVNLSEWYCFTVELIDCVFSGQLKKAFFNGSVPEDKRGSIGRAQNEIVGNDFSRLNLLDVDFRTGVDLARQTLPDSSEYCYVGDAASAVAGARTVVSEWDSDSKRASGLALVDMLEDQVAAGQNQLFFRVSDYEAMGSRVVSEVVAALTVD